MKTALTHIGCQTPLNIRYDLGMVNIINTRITISWNMTSAQRKNISRLMRQLLPKKNGKGKLCPWSEFLNYGMQMALEKYNATQNKLGHCLWPCSNDGEKKSPISTHKKEGNTKRGDVTRSRSSSKYLPVSSARTGPCNRLPGQYRCIVKWHLLVTDLKSQVTKDHNPQLRDEIKYRGLRWLLQGHAVRFGWG